MVQYQEMKETLAEIVPRVDWETDLPLMESGLLDSLDILMIVAKLYARFQTEIPPEELTAENFNSVESIRVLYERYEGSVNRPVLKILAER